MKNWVGLVGWPTADGLPRLVVTRQPQVERRTAKVRSPVRDRRSTIIKYVKIRVFFLKRTIRLIRTEQLWTIHGRRSWGMGGMHPPWKKYAIYPLQVGLPPAKNTKFVVTTWVLSSSECTKTRFRPGIRPGPHWGSLGLRRSPRLPSRLGRGNPLSIPFPLDAFGVSISPPSPSSSNRNLRQWNYRCVVVTTSCGCWC